MKEVKAGLVGSAGLSAEVLIELLVLHEKVELKYLVSESSPGIKISKIHESLRKLTGKETVPYEPQRLIEECDVIFFSKPHITNLNAAIDLVMLSKQKGKNTKFIDLGGDFRLKNPDEFQKWYVTADLSPEIKKLWADCRNRPEYHVILKDASYGLSEINRDRIKNSYFIANPGCYPTGALLGIVPLMKAGIAGSREIIVNAYSGVSGAGRTKKPGQAGFTTTTTMQRRGNIIPYKIGEHQHIPEMEQELSGGGDEVRITFAPHVVSFKYGILSTISLKFKEEATMDRILEIYNEFYRGSKFIRIRKKEYPQLQNVVKTNFCDIGFTIDERNQRIVVVTAIDNLYKGASGQAVQNMNIMFGFDETEGLNYEKG